MSQLIHFIAYHPKLERHVDLYFKNKSEAKTANPTMSIKRAEDWADCSDIE